jgi:hypothetical protein
MTIMTDNNQFVSLEDLINEKNISFDTLSFAIEMYGLWEFEFDKVKKLKADSEQLKDIKLILSKLSWSFFENDEITEKLSSDFEKISVFFGWPFGDLPEFDDVEKKRNSKLRKVNWFLDKFEPVAHAGLANEIEWYGIYELDKNQNFKHFGPESKQAQDVLTAISIRLYVDRSEEDFDWEQVYEDTDAIYRFGWPTEKIPSFRCGDEFAWVDSFHRLKSRQALFKKDLYTIGRILLTRKAKPSSIVKAIERTGVYGYNDWADLIPLAFDAKNLDELKKHLKIYADVLLKEELPDVSLLEATPYHRFGWPDDQLPDFEAIQNEPVMDLDKIRSDIGSKNSDSKNPTDDDPDLGRIKKSGYDATVAGLLMFIRGKLTKSKHKEYVSQEQLAELIEQELQIRGISVRSIKEKFADANELLRREGIDPGTD